MTDPEPVHEHEAHRSHDDIVHPAAVHRRHHLNIGSHQLTCHAEAVRVLTQVGA